MQHNMHHRKTRILQWSTDLILSKPDKILIFHHGEELMAKVINLAILEGEQMTSHRLAAHTA